MGGQLGYISLLLQDLDLARVKVESARRELVRIIPTQFSLLFYHWLVPCPLLSLSLSLSSTHTLVYPQGRLESELAKTIDLVHIEK